MTTKSQNIRPILFPVPEDGSALAPENLPSFPAFPVGRDGNWMRVAVPSLIIVPVDMFAEECQELVLAGAVEIVTKAETKLAGVPVECVPLCERYPTDKRPTPPARLDLLRRLSATAHAWAADASATLDERGAEDARKAGAEILALLSLFQSEGLSGSTAAIV